MQGDFLLSNIKKEMKSTWDLRAQKDAYHYIETKLWNHDHEKFFALGEERAQILIDPVLKKLGIEGSDKTAVDIGCGVGRFTQSLGRRFAKVTGVDVSDSMIAQARLAAPLSDNLEFIASDGMSLPQNANSADFVWSYEVFQHMPSHEIIMANLCEIRRILRSDGYGLLHFRSAQEYPTTLWRGAQFVPTSLVRAIKRLLGRDPLKSDQYWSGAGPLKKTEIQAMCKNSGLEVIEFRDDPTHEPGTRIFALVRLARH